MAFLGLFGFPSASCAGRERGAVLLVPLLCTRLGLHWCATPFVRMPVEALPS